MEDPSPKDCKNLIKLLKQIKKEQKLLEATSILENGNTEAYLSKGQALAPLTALFHKKVPVAVIERVGACLFVKVALQRWRTLRPRTART
mmetsp:Transcript_24529/g.53134  ORF Transcript_24529/g.53134 Transcript_24529/m.53134 type:complete len:90 (-) Transcript_24529:165-434(-)